MKLTEATIKTLKEKGATRWTKGDNDRLYLNDATSQLLEIKISYYKSGNISSATMQGEEVSNAEAGRIISSLEKAYIDLKPGALVTKKADSYRDLLEAALKDLIESEKAQEATPEPSAETPIKETGAADSVHEKKEEGKKALTQDQLTQYTGIDHDASSGISYLWLVVKAGDEEIRVTRIVDAGIEADTPEIQAAWDHHWDDMYAEYLEKLAAI